MARAASVLGACLCCCAWVAGALQVAPAGEKLQCPQLDGTTLLGNKALELHLSRNSREAPEKGCPPATLLHPIKHRADLGGELKRLGLRGAGVEVGVQKGLFTEQLLKNWGQADVYVQVDLWRQQDNYRDLANVFDGRQAELQDLSCSRGLEAVSNNQTQMVVQCQNYSTSCAQRIPDGSLDFVYLDARHDRKGVLEDLAAYWPKIRAGGVMAGHDYTTQDEPDWANDPEKTGQNWTVNYDGTRDASLRVTRGAIDDFFGGTEETPADLQRCPRQLVITYKEEGWNTWMVAK